MLAAAEMVPRLRATFSTRTRVFALAITLVLLYLLGTYLYLGPLPSKVIQFGIQGAHTPAGGTIYNMPVEEQISASSNNTRVLLVSAMFPLKHSKHTTAEYADWLSRFLGPITTDIYFYTTPEMEATVRAARGPSLNITVNTTYTSPFDIPPMTGLEEIYQKIHHKDREMKKHSPELYAVWNAKPFLLTSAMNLLAKEGRVYDFVFWTDAGSFRKDHYYSAWPNGDRVQHVWDEGSRLTRTNKSDLIFFPIFDTARPSARNWKEDMGPIDDEISEGSFFGGAPPAVSWWSEIFYKYHDHYLSLSYFVGKDQTIINAILFLYPERFITVWLNDPVAPAHRDLVPYFDAGYLGACGMEWYYYQFWLSDLDTQREMQNFWMNNSRWRGWSWWRNRQKCRLTRILSMKNILQQWFGKSWRMPSRTV
ncbi:hypothetical protein BDQ17DRAFT_1343994 [Cyathus striatus]|nr:hypothetical protein BDQ17DRAFT_1343994 [Cyathus striatus]